MTYDNYANFAASLVATAPSPATSGTSLIVTAGTGANLPTPPFDAPVWPTGSEPTAATAEIVRVTAIATDTLTIVRGPQAADPGGINRSIVIGDNIAANITLKALTDLQSGCLLAYAQYAPSTAGSYSLVTIATGLTAIDTTNLKVTFTGPLSGLVQVKQQALVQGAASAGKNVIFGLVSSTGSPGTLVGLTGVALSSATSTALDDQNICTMEQFISVTPGTSYTWYFAAAYVTTAAKIIPQGGTTNTTSVTGAPALIEVRVA